MLIRTAFLLFFCSLFAHSFGQIYSLSGKVSSKDGEALPFANVYVAGSSIGSTSNEKGLYKLDLPAGTYKIAFRSIAYKLKTEQLVLTGNQVFNVNLEPESYSLKEVSIRSDKEDPAYEIIRQAQKKRKLYLNEVQEYSCKVYTKGTQHITSYPKQIFGQKLNARRLNIIDSVSGIIYLSESLSNFAFKAPAESKEEMISSHVSGNNRSFSFNRAFDQAINFYQALVKLEGLSERGLVSPIGPGAFLTYRFQLLGTFTENGVVVNKIKVTPKKETDPAFSGFIYIAENSWRIHSLDLQVTKNNGIKFVDTLKINTSFLPLASGPWMRLSSNLFFDFKFLGVKGNGKFIMVYSDYNLNPNFSKNYFKGGEVAKVLADANKKDSTYWLANRPMPLTAEEKEDYKQRDSIQIIKESKSYLDSTDKIDNKFKATNLLLGYSYKNSYRKERYSFNPLSGLQYNTVEGLVINLNTAYNKYFENRKHFDIAPVLRYGFASKTLYGQLDFRYAYNPQKLSNFYLSFGKSVQSFSTYWNPGALLNTFYTLLDKSNYLKLYERKFFEIRHKSEVWNGFNLSTGLKYEKRTALSNNTDFSFVQRDKSFSPNTPVVPSYTKNPLLNLLQVQVLVRLTPGQEYISRPNGRFILGSKYPSFIFSYRQGINVNSHFASFAIASAGLEYDVALGLVGNSSMSASVGKFLYANKVSIPDLQHFLGNQTLIASYNKEQFLALPYFAYSTAKYYAEGHIEHNFGGFIVNKIPLLRKLRLSEIANFNYLYTAEKKGFYEYAIGVQRGLVPLRLMFFQSFAGAHSISGLRFFLPIN